MIDRPNLILVTRDHKFTLKPEVPFDQELVDGFREWVKSLTDQEVFKWSGLRFPKEGPRKGFVTISPLPQDALDFLVKQAQDLNLGYD